jgi:hypothetical protein
MRPRSIESIELFDDDRFSLERIGFHSISGGNRWNNLVQLELVPIGPFYALDAFAWIELKWLVTTGQGGDVNESVATGATPYLREYRLQAKLRLSTHSEAQRLVAASESPHRFMKALAPDYPQLLL